MATKKKKPSRPVPVAGLARSFAKAAPASRVPHAISSLSADLAEFREDQSKVDAELQEDQTPVNAATVEDQSPVSAAAIIDQSPVSAAAIVDQPTIPAPNPIYPVLPKADQPSVKAVSKSKADQIYADVKIGSLIPAYLAARKK